MKGIDNDLFIPIEISKKYSRGSLIKLIEKAYGDDKNALDHQLEIFKEQSHTEYVTEFLFELAEKIHELSYAEALVPGSSFSIIRTFILNKLEQ